MRTTVSLTLLSFAFALVVGTVVAALRVSPIPPLRAAGSFYITAVRNTPLAVLMILFFSGFPDIGIRFESFFVSAVIVLAAYTGTFVAETVRSGINAVAHGHDDEDRQYGPRQDRDDAYLPAGSRTEGVGEHRRGHRLIATRRSSRLTANPDGTVSSK